MYVKVGLFNYQIRKICDNFKTDRCYNSRFVELIIIRRGIIQNNHQFYQPCYNCAMSPSIGRSTEPLLSLLSRGQVKFLKQKRISNYTISYFHDENRHLSYFHQYGIAMLFSAGTFLYVATVHVLADITQGSHTHNYDALPQIESAKQNSASSRLKTIELLFLVMGCLCPLFLSAGHHH